MSDTIWKFPLQWEERQKVRVPADYEVLAVQMQGVDPCMWLRVNPESEKVFILVTLVGTGYPIPDDAGVYIGTVQISGFVWHFFERIF